MLQNEDEDRCHISYPQNPVVDDAFVLLIHPYRNQNSLGGATDLSPKNHKLQVITFLSFTLYKLVS
jgi:hypothetical protein